MTAFLNRFPTRRQLLPVFSIIVFIIYTWMFYRFFYQLPSWLHYMGVVNILIILVYVLSYALFESVVFQGLVLLLCFIFPARYFKDKFVSQGTFLAFVIALIAYGLREEIQLFPKLEPWVLAAIPVVVLVGLLLLVVVASKILDRFPRLGRGLNDIAERMTIFFYLYAPLGLVSFLVVILRNLS